MSDVKMKKSALLWLLVSVFVIVIDQFSKYFANTSLAYDKPVAILPILNLTLRFNPGASFGFLSTQSGWQVIALSIVTVAVVLGLLVWLWRLPRGDKLNAFAISLIIGGACGNLIDRVRLSYVVDFVDFHWGEWHFATLNLSDVAISVGAFFLILAMFRR